MASSYFLENESTSFTNEVEDDIFGSLENLFPLHNRFPELMFVQHQTESTSKNQEASPEKIKSSNSTKMTISGSPCGACKFLRRKCERGCVFAPYFCHEQGATHFAAIHRVFSASNVSKLLADLPVTCRCEAAFTIAYEAQARVQDPIYGCVSHIFTLQQQVVSLQSQLAFLQEQAAQSLLNGRLPSYTPQQDIQTWFQESENSCINMPQFDQNSSTNNMNEMMNFSNRQNLVLMEEDGGSFSSFQEGSSYSIDCLNMQISHNKEWVFHENTEDLHLVVFGYIQH